MIIAKSKISQGYSSSPHRKLDLVVAAGGSNHRKEKVSLSSNPLEGKVNPYIRLSRITGVGAGGILSLKSRSRND